MKKVFFLLGVAVGFLLGSRAGTEPYRKFEQSVRSVVGRPEVQSTIDNAKGAAKVQVAESFQSVNDRIASAVD